MAERTATQDQHLDELGRERAIRGGFRESWRRFRRNRLAVIGIGVLIVLYALAILAPVLTPYEPNRIFLGNRFTTPGSEHWLGTDEVGRDVFTRLLYGSRISLTVGLIATTLALLLGSVVGGTGGFVGGFVDSALMRVVDGMLAIPTFFLALLILALFGPSLRNVIIVIGLTSWMVVARVVRSEVLRAKNEEYVNAAISIGASPIRVLARHIMPQAMPSMIVAATLGVAYAVIVESSLSFLGLGVVPPTPTWGNMLSGSQAYIWNRPDLAIYPGLMILLSVLAFNMVGDALRDTLDPRQTGE
jgi:peptide/nickel transport system permease protein